MICKAIEESRVTRGIGRCRHSSNFSNRQTPGNTNSLGDRNSSKDGSSCQCGQGKLLKDDKTNSTSSGTHHHHHHHHRRRNRRMEWLRAPIRTFFRRIRAVDRDFGESSSSANEYAYQIAEIQQKQQHHHRNKHRRAESVSSDNYSSSRSDSVKAIGCGLPLRMVGRRRNSWTVTRKPSSDSNLSSSRNDSSTSAMTASTSAGTTTWRNSRSSVSSDGGSSSKGSVRERLPIVNKGGPTGAVVPMTHLPSVDGTRRTSSIRDKANRALPTSPLAAGIVRQQSVATPTGNLVQRTIITHTLSTSSTDGASPAAGSSLAHPLINPAVVVVTAPGATGPKGKPRLMRQIAVQQEENAAAAAASTSATGHKSVSFNTSNLEERPHFCPLHTPRLLEGVWESSIEEDDQEDEDEEDEEGGDDGPNNRSSLLQAVASIYTNRDKNRLGLAGFVPRKLSTISSRSCSIVNQEVEEAVVEKQPQSASQSSELLNVMADSPQSHQRAQHLLSKSDNDLYCHQKPAEDASRPVGSMTRLAVPPAAAKASASSTATKRAISGITTSSFEMIDDDFDDDVFHPQQQPARQQRLDAQQRAGGSSTNETSPSERAPLIE